MPATTPFKVKFAFVRNITLDEDVKKTYDGYSRDMIVQDKNGQEIRIQFKGKLKKHLLVSGLRGDN